MSACWTWIWPGATAPPGRCCAAPACLTTCAGWSPTRSTNAWISTSRRARKGTPWTATTCAWPRWPKACASSSRRWTQLPAGDYVSRDLPERIIPPRGEVYHAVEGARGKIGVYLVSDGTLKPYRVKLRSPGFSNLSLFAELAQGTLLADAVSIMGSLDLVIPEIDR